MTVLQTAPESAQPVTTATVQLATLDPAHQRAHQPAATDPELAELIATWPTLPLHIRAAVRALVATVIPPTPPCGSFRRG